MKTAGKVTVALALVILALGAGAVWLMLYPWRLATRAAGLGNLPRRGRRSHVGAASVALVEGAVAIGLAAFGLRRQGRRVTPAWHPCENCGAPIDLPSRAAYCSQACRRDANIRQRAALEAEAPPF